MNAAPSPRRWSPGARLLLVFATVFLVAGVTTAGVAAAVIYRTGTIGVDVETAEADVSVTVPAGLANLAIALVPNHLLSEVTDELRPWVPMVENGYRELLAAPDFVLCEVLDGSDHVVVKKHGRSIDILVESNGDRIEVSVPLRTVGYVIDKLS